MGWYRWLGELPHSRRWQDNETLMLDIYSTIWSFLRVFLNIYQLWTFNYYYFNYTVRFIDLLISELIKHILWSTRKLKHGIIENNKKIRLLYAQIVLSSSLEREALSCQTCSSSTALDYLQPSQIFGKQNTVLSLRPMYIFTEIHKHCTGIKPARIFATIISMCGLICIKCQEFKG